MQFKRLAALLFVNSTLAAPQATSTSSLAYEISILNPVPNSILAVIATAIPANWFDNILSPDSSASSVSHINAGTLLAWYDSLPADVKDWALSAYGFDASIPDSVPSSILSVIATAIRSEINVGTLNTGYSTLPASDRVRATGAYHDSIAAASNTAADIAITSDSASTVSTAGSVESSSATLSGTVSWATSPGPKATSPSASSAHGSATSTGSAPVATYDLAMSIVGAAGILGFALAL